MDQDSSVRLAPGEARQLSVMKLVLEALQDTPYVLKGGAALLFTRNLRRHTTDLDFDSAKPLNIENRIRDGLKRSGVKVKSLKAVKNTSTVQRFKIHYEDPNTGIDVLFKIETSFRDPPISEQIEIINGIQTYNISQLFEHKMAAAEGRTEARDLFDLTHIIQNYGNHLSTKQIERVNHFSNDIDSLAARYEESFQSDDVLMQKTDSDEIVLKLRAAIQFQMETELHNKPSEIDRLSPEMQEEATKFLNAYMQDAITVLISNMEKTGFAINNEDNSKSFESSALSWNLDSDGKANITRLSDGKEITPQSVTPFEMNAIRDFIIKVHEQYIGQKPDTQNHLGTNQKPSQKPKL